MDRSNAASFDKSHSLALLLAAHKTGHVSIDVPDDETGEAIRTLLIAQRRSVSRFKRRALEMAVMFDHIDLWALPHHFNVERLTDGGVVRTVWRRGDAMVDSPAAELYAEGVRDERTVDRIPSAWIWNMRDALFSSVRAEMLAQARFSDTMNVSHPALSAAYDVVFEVAREGGDVRALRHDLWSFVIDSFDDLRSPLLSVAAFQDLGSRLKEAGLDPKEAAPALLAVSEVVPEAWQMFLFSTVFSIPLVTRARFPSQQDDRVQSFGDAFTLCQASMKDLISYMPVVEDFDDVMRLRNHAAISRFRELLAEWASELRIGNAEGLKRIRADIERASADFRKLPKWRKAEDLVSWLQVPIGLVPLIGTIFTIVSMAGAAIVERAEKECSWVAIGSETAV